MKVKKEDKYIAFYVEQKFLIYIAILLIGFGLGYGVKAGWFTGLKGLLPEGKEEMGVIPLSPVATPSATSMPEVKTKKTWEGVASWYSIEGCLGCNPDRIMANGEVLDDTKKTIAFNKVPLGSKVKVLNLDNQFITEAIVTDRGDFEKYGRIADLSLATLEALNTNGNPRVKITLLE